MLEKTFLEVQLERWIRIFEAVKGGLPACLEAWCKNRACVLTEYWVLGIRRLWGSVWQSLGKKLQVHSLRARLEAGEFFSFLQGKFYPSCQRCLLLFEERHLLILTSTAPFHYILVYFIISFLSNSLLFKLPWGSAEFPGPASELCPLRIERYAFRWNTHTKLRTLRLLLLYPLNTVLLSLAVTCSSLLLGRKTHFPELSSLQILNITFTSTNPNEQELAYGLIMRMGHNKMPTVFLFLRYQKVLLLFLW